MLPHNSEIFSLIPTTSMSSKRNNYWYVQIFWLTWNTNLGFSPTNHHHLHIYSIYLLGSLFIILDPDSLSLLSLCLTRIIRLLSFYKSRSLAANSIHAVSCLSHIERLRPWNLEQKSRLHTLLWSTYMGKNFHRYYYSRTAFLVAF